eukprot:GILJ01002997.1.p1 GENE.GILJ01002997.1~~GILJ01002997.1.p1  ORF type:complete len:390 (-),score=46.61 GILJ01002997.1:201-1370(-)
MSSLGKAEWAAIDDGEPTHTSKEQAKIEKKVIDEFQLFRDSPEQFERIELLKELHYVYISDGFESLPESYSSLDASRAWILFWNLHGLELLGHSLEAYAKRTIEFLKACECPTGGYGGGPGQLPHLAPTYAAVMSLLLIGTEESYNAINRGKLYDFLLKRKNPDGSFSVHDGGESDVRGAYCAMAVASILNIMTEDLERGVHEYIVKCQTYEGGLGGEPDNEAHGGYTYCGLAAMLILGKADRLDLDRLLAWSVNRQMAVEGGFQGRTNKLVDSCYSFWQGAVFEMVDMAMDNSANHDGTFLFDEGALQMYNYVCCQDVAGGLRDKPGKWRDYYHTCYALSGIACAQHGVDDKNTVTGAPSNTLRRNHPIFNISHETAAKALARFGYFH